MKLNDSIYIGQRGHRRILGADHPRDVSVRKNGERQFVAYQVCNGICEWQEVHRTKRDALEAAQARVEEGACTPTS